MPKRPLSLVEILDAARAHQRDLADLVARLEYLTGKRTPPLVPPRTAQKTAQGAPRAPRATNATANGHPPPARSRPATGRRRALRSVRPLEVLILEELARHPGAKVAELREHLRKRGEWRTSSRRPDQVLSVALSKLATTKRVLARGANGAKRYRVAPAKGSRAASAKTTRPPANASA